MKRPRTETQSSDDNCRSDDVEIDIDDFWAKEESDTTRAKKATDFARCLIVRNRMLVRENMNLAKTMYRVFFYWSRPKGSKYGTVCTPL